MVISLLPVGFPLGMVFETIQNPPHGMEHPIEDPLSDRFSHIKETAQRISWCSREGMPTHGCIACPEGRGCCICHRHDHSHSGNSTVFFRVTDQSSADQNENGDIFLPAVTTTIDWNLTGSHFIPAPPRYEHNTWNPNPIYMKEGDDNLYMMIEGREFRVHATPVGEEELPEEPSEPEPQENDLWDHIKDDD